MPRHPQWGVLFGGLALALAGSACIKRAPVVKAAEPTPVVLATALSNVEERGVVAAPDEVVTALTDELRTRDLLVEPLAAGTYIEAFGQTRNSGHRFALVGAQSGGEAVLLVESEARFSSQINGRYRWTVAVTATMGTAGSELAPLEDSFDVPVHLVRYNEREAEALIEAAPVIARRVGQLASDWITASGAAP